MKYKSTRGKIRGLSFKEAVMTGLAGDGGLLVPEEIPCPDIYAWQKLSYQELAYEIYSLFCDDIPSPELKALIKISYADFRREEVVGIRDISGIKLLELFYGPTLSFKDIALQFLGNLFEYILKQDQTRLNVLGATSGDTGSAAIYGLKGKSNIKVFILHPFQKVSPVQEMQMTTVKDLNVFNIALKGSFDDCQKIVKDIFSLSDFKQTYSLGAVNSINWVRILAQTVYYFYAFFRCGEDKLDFSVPTGNFGDIFAGYLAKKMGLPIRRLILATNENDILSRFVNQGDYSIGTVVNTISPAMDIQIASNFERYLYYFYGQDADKTVSAMNIFQTEGALRFSGSEIKRVSDDFASYSVNTEEAMSVIKDVYQSDNYFLCPHTACGVGAARKCRDKIATIALATAHPAKFPEVVSKSTGAELQVPPQLAGLENLEKRMVVLDNSRDQVKAYIEQNADG